MKNIRTRHGAGKYKQFAIKVCFTVEKMKREL